MKHSVSVIVPVWNMARYLPDAIASIPQVHEILIVAAECDDNTVEVANELAVWRPEIRVLANPKKGPAAGRNVGLRAASGNVGLLLALRSFDRYMEEVPAIESMRCSS